VALHTPAGSIPGLHSLGTTEIAPSTALARPSSVDDAHGVKVLGARYGEEAATNLRRPGRESNPCNANRARDARFHFATWPSDPKVRPSVELRGAPRQGAGTHHVGPRYVPTPPDIVSNGHT
jgi:hypothetical protein